MTASSSVLPKKQSSLLFASEHNKNLLHALLRRIVCGEQKQVETIIKSYPELLFKSGTVDDHSGNTFSNFSPIELARYGHDVDMLQMIKPYAEKIEGGKEKFALVLQKASEYEAKQQVYDFSKLLKAMAGDNEQRLTALVSFRELFAPRIISHHEKSYNIKNLLKAYEVYVCNDERWWRRSKGPSSLVWSNVGLDNFCTFIATDKRSWSSYNEGDSEYWMNVIGYLQRSLPACYAQAFCQGLYTITEKGQALERNLYIGSRIPVHFFYSVDLGFRYAITTQGRSSTSHHFSCDKQYHSDRGTVNDTLLALGRLCQIKTAVLQDLMQPPDERAEFENCSIM